MLDSLPAIDFLLECENKLSQSTDENALKDYVGNHESGSYYLRYELIKKDGSGVTETARQLMNVDNSKDLVSILRELLLSKTYCHGSWILLFKSEFDANRPNFDFDATNEEDSMYIYACFLYELGVLSGPPESWQRNNNTGFFSVEFTSIGKKIIESMKVGKVIVTKDGGADHLDDLQQPDVLVTGKAEFNNYSTEAKSFLGVALAQGGKK